jgi:3-hydroxyisobutyrate dehydrogenase-like beta-hydroxyacid dehydrogenase
VKVAIIGFGEAGKMFAEHLQSHADVHVYDIKQDAEIKAQVEQSGIQFQTNLADALRDSAFILSLVTADQAPIAASKAGVHLRPDQYFLEMNSIAPQTKQANIRSCCNLVDVAIMAPVYPLKASVPLLLSHPEGQALSHELNSLGLNSRYVDAEIGRAAAIKMCRSVMIKGMEALTLECFQTARFFDVENEIKASLDHSFPGMGWCEDRVDYWFERANTHGLRRAEEMREVAKQVLKVCLQQIALRHSQKTIVQ